MKEEKRGLNQEPEIIDFDNIDFDNINDNSENKAKPVVSPEYAKVKSNKKNVYEMVDNILETPFFGGSFKNEESHINLNEKNIFKKFWYNKKLRAIVFLIFYIIFFVVIISGLRHSYDNNTFETEKNENSVASKPISNIDNYDYIFAFSGEKNVIIIGKRFENKYSFSFNDKNYYQENGKILEINNNNLIDATIDFDFDLSLFHTDKIAKLIEKSKLSSRYVEENYKVKIYSISVSDLSFFLTGKKIDNDNPISYTVYEQKGYIVGVNFMFIGLDTKYTSANISYSNLGNISESDISYKNE